MPRVLVELTADNDDLRKGFRESGKAAESLSTDLKRLAIDAKTSASAQVQASVRKQARLRSEITAYREIASASKRGSREQVTAANLAAQAEGRLARSLAVTNRESQKLARSSQLAERNLGRGARGALAGSGAFHSLGRSLAFASGGYLSGLGTAALFRSVIGETARLQEETEKTGVVFGESAKDVQAWAGTLASSFGVGEAAALEAAGVFGNMFRSLHIGETDAAGMSKRLVQLAADMASFNNASPEDTLAALQSGLAGQVRPLRQYGVFLSQDRIKQEALSAGIAKNAAHLTAAQKVQAAYNIILRDTGLQQGDVARNTESLSVALSKDKAELQNAADSIGHDLLPQLVHLANAGGRRLHQMNETGELQRDVNRVTHDGAEIIRGLAAAFGVAHDVAEPFIDIVGGTKTAAELAGLAFIVMRGRSLAAAAGLRAQSAAALTLRGRLLALGRLGTITVAVIVGFEIAKGGQALSKWLGGTGLGKAIGAGDTPTKDFLAQLQKAVAAGIDETQLKKLLNSGILNKQQRDAVNDAIKRIEAAFRTGLNTEDRVPGRSPGGPAGQSAGGAGTVGRKNPRASLRYQLSLLDEQLAKAELTATQKDDRAVLVRQAALLRELIGRTKSLKERTTLYEQLGSVQSQIQSIDQAQADKEKTAHDAEVAAAKKRHDARQAHEKKLAELHKKHAAEEKAAFDTALETARSAIGELFAGPVLQPTDAQNKTLLGVPAPSAKTLTTDVRAQTAQSRRLDRDLAKLKRQGASSELLKELRAKGVGAIPQIEALTGASKKDRQAFFGAFGEREKLARREATMAVAARSVVIRSPHVSIAGARVTHGREQRLGVEGVPPIVVKVELDGREVAKKVTVHQDKAKSRTASQTRGRHGGR